MKMIKVEEIAEKYKGYEVDEEKLKEFLTPPKFKTVWDLKEGDKYWYNSANGNTDSSTWNNCIGDNCRRNVNNCFLTEEEAQFEVERRKIKTILLKYGRREFKYGKKNQHICCDFHELSIEIGCCRVCQDQGTIYFDTEELCRKAIKEAGEDNVKKYIFGIRKDEE